VSHSEHGVALAATPQRPVRLGRAAVVTDRRPDGTIYLQSAEELGPYPRKLTERLVHWAGQAPDRALFAQRLGEGGCRHISYAEALDHVRRIGEALIGRDLSADRPIVILSGNDIDHALLGLAANYVGIPYAPVSPAYSLISTDLAKLRYIFDLTTPGLVFAADPGYARAIDAVAGPDVEVVLGRGSLPSRRSTAFSDLTGQAATSAVDAAHAKVGPDTIAKLLFTSGSTGMPKAVINTQRMWCSNQEMIRHALSYFEDEAPVIVDWAPWHHTAGGNHNVGIVLYNGGTLYIDEGTPLPGAIEMTVRNLREVAPNWYFNVPKGFEALLPYLRSEPQLRRNFFSRLRVLWYAGAGIAPHVFEEMRILAARTCGERIPFLTGLGSTETGPYAFGRTWDTDEATNIGLPPPGVEVKLVPEGERLEARVRGPSITPGYWRNPALTAAAFDAEGFYRLGDALRFEDPANPGTGLLFDGRLAEDFKLSSGTWVNVGPLRVRFIERFAPLVRDVVVAGLDRDDIAVLVFPDVDACRRLALLPADAPAGQVIDRVRPEFQRRLEALARESTGSSNRVRRAVLLEEPPSLDDGEVTDKGSINQRAVLRRRAALVDGLYATPPPPQVIAVAETDR
jgi:feruloyl-CoA synthase